MTTGWEKRLGGAPAEAAMGEGGWRRRGARGLGEDRHERGRGGTTRRSAAAGGREEEEEKGWEQEGARRARRAGCGG